MYDPGVGERLRCRREANAGKGDCLGKAVAFGQNVNDDFFA
jgi:hypothetical protein